MAGQTLVSDLFRPPMRAIRSSVCLFLFRLFHTFREISCSFACMRCCLLFFFLPLILPFCLQRMRTLCTSSSFACVFSQFLFDCFVGRLTLETSPHGFRAQSLTTFPIRSRCSLPPGSPSIGISFGGTAKLEAQGILGEFQHEYQRRGTNN